MGGSLLVDSELLGRIVGQVPEIQDQGHEVILVHGGGKQIKQYLEQLKIPSHFHNGLRVTDPATMQVVQMVLAGLVNKAMVAAFGKLGRRAAGICGGDGMSFVARKYVEASLQADSFDYGYVGEIFEGDPTLVNLLLSRQFTPIVACIGIGRDGAYYNVNADEMAAAVAIFCRAERLLFLTDVPGVLDRDKQVIPRLDRLQIQALRDTGVISEGMLPKTRACERALQQGIRQIHIVGGREPDCLIRLLVRNERLGTELH